MTTKDLTKPVSLLEVGDNYVQATWRHHSSSTEIIGIFRKTSYHSDSDKWVMEQPLRGPWSVLKKDKVANDPTIAVDAFLDVSGHAMGLFTQLQTGGIKETKQAWLDAGGIVYDL